MRLGHFTSAAGTAAGSRVDADLFACHGQQRVIEASQALCRAADVVADEAAAAFYSRLFKLDPSLRRLFTGDLRQQGKKLMDLIALTTSLAMDFVYTGRLTG